MEIPEICKDCSEKEWCNLDPDMWKCEYTEEEIKQNKLNYKSLKWSEKYMNKQTTVNGWIVEENKFDGFPATQKYLTFHPIYDGHHWEQHDTMEEAMNFCTVERFNEWSNNLL